MKQLKLFRDTILCKMYGCLVLIKVNPFGTGSLKCPICKGTEFIEGSYGWIECTGECDFALLEKNVIEIKNQ